MFGPVGRMEVQRFRDTCSQRRILARHNGGVEILLPVGFGERARTDRRGRRSEHARARVLPILNGIVGLRVRVQKGSPWNRRRFEIHVNRQAMDFRACDPAVGFGGGFALTPVRSANRLAGCSRPIELIGLCVLKPGRFEAEFAFREADGDPAVIRHLA